MEAFHYKKGESPLIVSMPHIGLEIPDDIKAHMTDAGKEMVDTDWNIDRLYDFLWAMDVTIIGAKYSRYVVDLNRGTDGVSLYPGQTVTTLCPTHTFNGDPLYQDGYEIDEADRINKYWLPYHEMLAKELRRLKEKHGYVRLWDAHSIKSHVPELFDGRLPDLNLGTGNGISADHALVEKLENIVRTSDYSSVLNGRFKGGYITRHYGDPKNQIHAVQLEISQITYMNELSNEFDQDKVEKLRNILKALIKIMSGSP
ncbi:N-formylglutamate deformylase [Pseudemcibacter aquimaris]|uniref:N-formylglutamate deformylase n=1 Tax=Pseudemcibacter aquimaris TaxID=2857064 RepID=UPI0020125303|nr:N-formylglutamate deformylase [Pseudemcibacter aquimaris]MCC3861996.1 N-formylglutamate deformylase [Pseudemcibacter aquimaris]WDU58748.1 N-formylglutamate deformylase [Pseudemcibacter aquimaris]